MILRSDSPVKKAVEPSGMRSFSMNKVLFEPLKMVITPKPSLLVQSGNLPIDDSLFIEPGLSVFLVAGLMKVWEFKCQFVLCEAKVDGLMHRGTEIEPCSGCRGVDPETRYHAIWTISGHHNCDFFLVLVHNIDMRRHSLCQANKGTKTALGCKFC